MNNTTASLSKKTLRAISKYGIDKCRQAYHLNRVIGEGPSTIGFHLELATRQADAAINAGEEIAKLDASAL